ncbi:MSC_0622 family F1-like ATPase gamma subunit [Mycoplasma procyoni]|uniref:MSC_0622 family F1-like ATPase gamma subunit n=1 Tax=Mycoplasma procyoni TaxID=568784 RepID=UPI00197C2891|nr:hypothetical protein [Mycoplasma procyoni]MBN3534776.1 hypothetical protein [Mycoplasma procyoni]
MKQNNIKNRNKVFESLLATTNIAKIETISSILKINKSFENKLENSMKIKEILVFLENKHKLKSIFSESKNKQKNPKKLWVYITEKNEEKNSEYLAINQLLKDKIKRDDLFISIGEYANDFAKQNNITPLISYDSSHTESTPEIENIITNLYFSFRVNEVVFVLNTNRIDDYQLTILPFTKMNFKTVSEYNQQNLQKKLFLPDIQTFFINSIKMYLNAIIPAILIESQFFQLKQKLIKENKIIDDLEAKIKEIKRIEKEIKRQKLTEEMVLLSNNAGETHE